MMPGPPIPAFQAFGIELEYAIVDAQTLEVAALAPVLLERMPTGLGAPPFRFGWSNELVEHVVEVKNIDPVPTLDTLPVRFQAALAAARPVLASLGARLLPTGMHPWMDPKTQTRVWTRSDAAIYAAYDRIFDCRRHGWANVQSMHINLPFAGDEEFRRLHAAVRLVLPLIPALAASSPFAEGRWTGVLDHRLQVYATNSCRFPQVTGRVIPENVTTCDAYRDRVLSPMYAAMQDVDPHGVLRHEWLNARGAIPRFDRSALEIRLADVQECPAADLAIARLVSSLVRTLFDQDASTLEAQESIPTDRLAHMIAACVRDGDAAIVDCPAFLAAIGSQPGHVRAGAIWAGVFERMAHEASDDWVPFAERLVSEGPLARRILRSTGTQPGRGHLRDAYLELAHCLDTGAAYP